MKEINNSSISHYTYDFVANFETDATGEDMFEEDIRIEAEHELLDGGTFTAGISYFINPTIFLRSYFTVTNTNVEFTGVNLGLKQTHFVHSSSCSGEFCRPQFLIVRHEYHLLASPK